MFYAPNFVSEADEQTILARTYANPLSLEDADPRSEWVALRSRRLKCWGGQPGKHFRPEPLPPWVEALCDALVERGVFTSEGRPNHVLLNGENMERDATRKGMPDERKLLHQGIRVNALHGFTV